jgi:hypothetical protein
MTTGRRKSIHGNVDQAAHDAWHGFGAEHGFSVSALLQEIGDDIDAVLGPDTPGGQALIRRARLREAAGRRRAGRPRT